jgi:hypothetical protein
MRFPTIRKGIDTSEVVLSSLAEGENTSRNRAELPLSTAESNSSRSSPEHRRTPDIRLRCPGSTSPQLGHVCGLSDGLLAGWILWGEGGRAGEGEGKEGGRLDDEIVIRVPDLLHRSSRWYIQAACMDGAAGFRCVPAGGVLTRRAGDTKAWRERYFNSGRCERKRRLYKKISAAMLKQMGSREISCRKLLLTCWQRQHCVPLEGGRGFTNKSHPHSPSVHKFHF